MAILNYSTKIPVHQTLGEIHARLAKAGAKYVMTDYDAGQPSAIAFTIETAFGPRSFRLPANVTAIRLTLQRQYEAGQVDKRFATQEHAARVAWRIVLDWLQVQIAMVEAEQASLDQIMLPYLVDQGGRTLYEAMVARRMLPPGEGE